MTFSVSSNYNLAMQYYFIGAPGSGKTTAAIHLASSLKLPYIGYRILIHDYLKKSSKKASLLKELWLNYKPFPPKMAFEVLKEHLESLPQTNLF